MGFKIKSSFKFQLKFVNSGTYINSSEFSSLSMEPNNTSKKYLPLQSWILLFNLSPSLVPISSRHHLPGSLNQNHGVILDSFSFPSIHGTHSIWTCPRVFSFLSLHLGILSKPSSSPPRLLIVPSSLSSHSEWRNLFK